MRLVNHEITVYGASDDLIEIEGDVRDEFDVPAKGAVLVIGPSGEVVKVVCELADAGWTATPQIVRGGSTVGIEQGPRPDNDEEGDMAVTLRFSLAEDTERVLVFLLPEDQD